MVKKLNICCLQISEAITSVVFMRQMHRAAAEQATSSTQKKTARIEYPTPTARKIKESDKHKETADGQKVK